MKLTMPIRTYSKLNAREHWRERARRTKRERNAATLLFPYGVKLPCAVTMIRLAPRALDDDNLRGSFKAVRDGIADKLGVDDRDPRVEWRYGQRKDKGYAVEVQVEAP